MKRLVILVVLALLCGACARKRIGSRSDGADGGDTDDGGSDGMTDETAGFALMRQEVRTLPFRLLQRKVAYVVGKPADDPFFATMLATRFDLGDYDHLGAIGGDETWGPQRAFAWTKQMVDLCATPLMRSRFPGEAGAVELWETAFGRSPAPEDLDAIKRWLATAVVSRDRAEVLTCAGVLSSTEFIAR